MSNFRYFSGTVSDRTLLQLECLFYKEYAERYYQIKQFEKTIPVGWRTHPKRRKTLLDVNAPWSEPIIVPCDFPPRLSQQHLMDMLNDHTSHKRPLMPNKLAELIAERAPANKRACNFMLLHNGPLDPTDLAHNWITHRLFQEMDKEEGAPVFQKAFVAVSVLQRLELSGLRIPGDGT